MGMAAGTKRPRPPSAQLPPPVLLGDDIFLISVSSVCPGAFDHADMPGWVHAEGWVSSSDPGSSTCGGAMTILQVPPQLEILQSVSKESPASPNSFQLLLSTTIAAGCDQGHESDLLGYLLLHPSLKRDLWVYCIYGTDIAVAADNKSLLFAPLQLYHQTLDGTADFQQCSSLIAACLKKISNAQNP